MRRILVGLVVTTFAIGASAQNSAAGTVFSASVIPNAAPDGSGVTQEIAGEPAAGTEWSIRKGKVKLRSRADDTFVIMANVKGLIVPVLLGGVQQGGTTPGRWFAVSGF